MGMKLLPELFGTEISERGRTFGFFDDFFSFSTNVAETTTVLNTHTLWTVTASDNGSVAMMDAHGGIINCRPMNATTEDNNELYLHQRNETFIFKNNAPMLFEGRFKITAHNTTSLACTNWCFGVKDAWAANSLQDDGAGPAASYSGALIGTVDGSSYFFCESSLATTQTTVTGTGLTGETPSNATWFKARILWLPKTSTQGEVHFFVDDGTNGWVEIGLDSNGNAHVVTYASATEMEVGCGIKAGSDHRHAFQCDYIQAYALR